jgi:hypothetical protein
MSASLSQKSQKYILQGSPSDSAVFRFLWRSAPQEASW